MNNFQNEPQPRTINTQVGLRSFLTKMYGYMSLAVLVSAITVYLSLTVFRTQVFSMFGQHPVLFLIIFMVSMFAMIGGIQVNATRNPARSFGLLMLFAVVFGVEISITLALYTGATITGAFIAATAVFGTMAIIGTTTKRDISRLGTHLFAALIGLLVASVVNLFLQSAMISYVFSYIGVLIFAGLSMWDANRMRDMYLQYGDQVSSTGLAVSGALQLYLDFVNLFLYFIQIFAGGDRD
ncbi:Bax inhibitor-1/YccA family protein [Lactiplantibacillus modestisalitolerans]|uniref:Bax inhibitor-1 family protein n=1 Tax=Lactiplantibacillus modestisalitolerans TaxID=1457219 RepID=A0ABV5WY99_9LACO|nr:Bax inhibitor-1/YccA family protein [Lactiplantibacillus modestisalitolerans]